MNILVVDDDPINLKIVGKYIGVFKFQISQAHDGIEAWSVLDTANPLIDIVLTDRMMPGMDGMELTRKIKQDPRYKDVPVIMLTAAVEAKQIIEGNEAGVFYYITKPFERDALVSIVESAIEEAHKAQLESKA